MKLPVLQLLLYVIMSSKMIKFCGAFLRAHNTALLPAFAPATVPIATTTTSCATHRCWMASVSGMVYTPDENTTTTTTSSSASASASSPSPSSPKVKLFTKEGCTLCDKVKDVLLEVKDEYPHSLQQVDITDDDNQEWFSKYKYDIPVLHINNLYWIKHRMTKEEAIQGLQEATDGKFNKPKNDEPDADAMERRQTERQQQQ